MDRDEKRTSQTSSEFANQGEVSERDAPALPSATGREDDQGAIDQSALADLEIRRPLGGRPMSEITGRHDHGSGANETEDGLNSTEEELRRGAEELPLVPEEDIEEVPVFDRADTLPKV
jgi:hypothetical protein